MSNRPLADLRIGLPADPQRRAAIVRILADAGLLTRAYIKAGLPAPPFAIDKLATKASYLASTPADVLDFRVLLTLST